MRRLRLSVFLMAFILVSVSCGVQPDQDYGARYPPREGPTPLPTRSIANPGFNRAQIPSHFNVTYSGPYWVQLRRRDIENTTIVVGVEPSRSGNGLEEEVKNHRSSIDYPPDGLHLGAGTIESDVLGQVLWSWGRFKSDEQTIDQLAIFASHPEDGVLLIARSEFPSEGDEIDFRLDELLAMAEIIGPGL